MEEFKNAYHLPKLKPEDIENLNRLITRNEIKSIIKSLPSKKSIGLDEFTAKFYQIFREDLTPILFKMSYKIES